MNKTIVTIQATMEEAQAVLNVLIDRFANIRPFYKPTGLSNHFNLHAVIHSTGFDVEDETALKIEEVVTTSLAAIRSFSQLMEGDDYNYSTQKNFD